MASLVSHASVLRAVLASDEIGLSVEVTRHGTAKWVSNDLEYTAWVYRDLDHKILCETRIGDAKFAEPMDQFGRMAVIVRPAGEQPDWPVGRKVPTALLAYLIGEFRDELGFVA